MNAAAMKSVVPTEEYLAVCTSELDRTGSRGEVRPILQSRSILDTT
jgi:hypothetical protein